MDPRRALIACATAALIAVAAFPDDAARPAASIGGTIRDAKGKPIAGAAVSVEGGGATKTAADGTWSVTGVAPGDVLVIAQSPGRFRVQTMLHVAAGESRSWDATIGMHGKITGHVVDEYGHPLTAPRGTTGSYGWQVIAIPSERWMQQPNSETWWGNTDATGAFALRVSPDALFRLAVRNIESRSIALVTEPMSAGLGDITLRVLPANMPHAHVHCRLEDSKGTSLTGDAASMQVYLFQHDRVFAGHVTIDAANGDWFSSRVATGTYDVVASHPTLGVFEFPAIEVRDAADVDLGALRFPPMGRVRFVPARSGPGSDAALPESPAGASWRAPLRTRSSHGPGAGGGSGASDRAWNSAATPQSRWTWPRDGTRRPCTSRSRRTARSRTWSSRSRSAPARRRA